MIKHIAIKDSEESYFQELTGNTIVLTSDVGFDNIVSTLQSSHTVFINSDDEEFVPNLEIEQGHLCSIIKNENQTIKFYVYESGWTVEQYKTMLNEFKSNIQNHEDIWFCANNYNQETGKFEYEIYPFTSFVDFERFDFEAVCRGIISGRFGFLYPESVVDERNKIARLGENDI